MPKVPLLPPITIRLYGDQRRVIHLPWLVSMLTAQLLFLPRNAAGQPVFDHVLRRHWPFDASGNQDAIWHDAGDLRTAVMTGIDLRPLSNEAIAKSAEKRPRIKPHTSKLSFLTRRWSGEGCLVEEDVQAVKQKIEDLKAEFERDYVGFERESALYDAAQYEIHWLVSARLKAFLAKDVAVGLLKRRSKDEEEYVLLADLVRWAEHRKIVIEKDEPLLTTKSTLAPWQIKDPRDPEPENFQPWYTAARFFARQEIRTDLTLVGANLAVIAERVEPLLPKVGYYKRNKEGVVIKAATIVRALHEVQLW